MKARYLVSQGGAVVANVHVNDYRAASTELDSLIRKFLPRGSLVIEITMAPVEAPAEPVLETFESLRDKWKSN